MKVQNLAFVPDAIPTAAAQTGMTAAAAAPGGGVFQQLLQGKQTRGKPVEKQAAAAERPAPEKTPIAPSPPAKAEEKPQSAQQEVNGAARDGLPAEAAQTPAVQKAVVQKAAVAGGKFPAHQATRKKEAAEEPGAALPAQGGEEAEAGAIETSRASMQNTGAEQEVAAAPKTTAGDQTETAPTRNVPAVEMRPESNPGLIVAMAAVESAMAARSEGANAEAGATALARLEAVQQRLQQPAVPEATADAGDVQPEQQRPGANRQNQPTGVAAGAKLSQEAELAKLTGEARGAQVLPSTGATEEAQVEKPQLPVAQGAATQQSPQLPDAAKTAVAADQAVAAAHLSAKQSGEGRFVAMPVRNLAANAGESTTATEPAASQTSPHQNGPQVQDGVQAQQGPQAQQGVQAQQGPQVQVQVPTREMATAGSAGTTGAAAREAEAEQATLTGKVKLHEEQGAAKQEQAEPVQVSKEEAARAAEKVPQRRELRQGEAVTGKQVREAEQAQGNLAKPSGDDVSGTKSASTATAKLVSEPGAVREMSGAQGEQGQSQQKGQEQNGQALGAGVTAQGNAEVAQADTKQAGSKSLLHESILSQVREGVVTHDGKGNGQMSIRLNPGELGELKIQLRMENNRLNVEVHADNHMVKELLMSNLDTLKEALSGKNLTMDGFNVSTGGGGFNGPLNEEKGNQRQQQPPRFARGTGYDGQEAPRVNYLTAEVNNLLDVRF